MLPWPPRRTPIARMRAKVKLRQVVTLRLPLWSPRHETSCAHPCRVPYCSFFSPLAERTPLPRGHVLPARDDLRLWGPRGTAIARLGAKHAVLAAVAMVRDRFRGCGWFEDLEIKAVDLILRMNWPENKQRESVL